MIYKQDQSITEQILVLDTVGSPVLGLIDGNFSKELLQDKGATSETLSITEKGSGFYYIDFTPEDVGVYSWKVSHATYDPNGWFDYYRIVGQDTVDNYDAIGSLDSTGSTDTDTILVAIGSVQSDTDALQVDTTEIIGSQATIYGSVDTLEAGQTIIIGSEAEILEAVGSIQIDTDDLQLSLGSIQTDTTEIIGSQATIYSDTQEIIGSEAILYTDTQEIIGSQATIYTDTQAIIITQSAHGSSIARILGMAYENLAMGSLVYDVDGNLTDATVDLYTASGSVGTGCDILATYQMTSTYDTQQRVTSYQVVKQ